TDLCDNIAGTQTSVPSGYYQSGSSCYPNPIDVCPTTPGTQTQTSQCNCTDMPSNPGCTVTGPDLTAGSISPAATSPNVSTTFSATITNQGNQTTGSAYNVLFQRATNSSGASATSLGTVSVTTTTAGQSRVASRAASLTQGTWYVRACADMNASMVGAISETNEGNNCGPWTQVVVGSAGSCANPVSVTGSTSGGLWGTNPYTTDSTLGKAAVHAGLLANGQSGTINVADVGTVGSFGGSTRNGVTSTAWPEAYPGMQLSACGPQSDPYPDLTAGAKSPSSATRNQAVTLSATVSNLTNKATNAAGMYVGGPGAGAFYTTFQRATNSSGAGATNITPAHVTGPLAGGASQTASVSYTFTTAGTFYVRACADTPSDNITESNEGNNCGAWSAITVTGTALSCNVSPSSVEVGKSVTYAVSGGSGSYVWQASDGGSYGSASIASRSFAAPGTYGMQVRMGSDGDSWVYCPNVTVAGPACTDAGPVEITASPSRVEQGDTVTLSWTGTNVSGACTVSGGSGSAAVNTSSNPASCTLSGTVTTGAVTTQSTYTVSCPGGQSDTVIVNVIPKFEEF
ncbi:MAG TPA: CARDB domain-containing protein, partial [Candidatus Paceibacterota bacterium]|nr:CARDB domain-containing protein [Candidatus Paceibacterota bacterium]